MEAAQELTVVLWEWNSNQVILRVSHLLLSAAEAEDVGKGMTSASPGDGEGGLGPFSHPGQKATVSGSLFIAGEHLFCHP